MTSGGPSDAIGGVLEVIGGGDFVERAASDGIQEVVFPSMPDRPFDVLIFADDDTLYLNVADFYGEWWPVNSSDVRANFAQAVEGVLTGQFRVVEYRSEKHCYESLLQARSGSGWETVYWHHHRIRFPWIKVHEHVYHRTAA